MDVTIIGGGAGGIACAVRIKQNNPCANVTVLEHLEEICKKIHATGNGRCNITNTRAEGHETTVRFLNSIGLELRTDSAGRVYPYSNQASTVVDVLRNNCESLGINIVLQAYVKGVEKRNGKYTVFTNQGKFTSDALVLATGGMAQSALGSDGSGYAMVKSFGHSLTELSPALVMLKSSSKHCRVLKGTRSKCRVSIEENGNTVASEYGELLFADYGISGIVVMDLSRYVSDNKIESGKSKYIASIDFAPEFTEKQLEEHINRFGSLEGILPKKLCSVLLKQADGNSRLTAKYAKNWRLIITGTKGFDFAQITKGGVPLCELDKNNQSLINKNLYIIGELTDSQFMCGGFNLNYAFLSGIKAADSITGKKHDKN